jgi:hypothetical protein
MATYPARLEIFFGISDFGWSTDHYYYEPQSTLTGAAFVSAANDLVAAYARCLAYGITIDAARASLQGVWRDSSFFKVPPYTLIPGATPPSFAYNAYTGNGPSTDPFDGINFRLEMTSMYRASEILSGLPAGSLVQPTIYPWNGTPFGATYKLIQALMTQLTGSAVEGVEEPGGGYWGGLVRAKGSDGPAPFTLASATVLNAGQITFTTTSPNSFVAGDPVRILGVSQPPNVPHVKVNGTYNVIPPVTSTTFTVSQPTAPVGATFFTVGATAQLIDLVIMPYTKWNFINQTHRKRGRRFGAPRGRSKRRAPGAVV